MADRRTAHTLRKHKLKRAGLRHRHEARAGGTVDLGVGQFFHERWKASVNDTDEPRWKGVFVTDRAT